MARRLTQKNMKVLTINCVNELYSTGKIIKDIEKYLANKDCTFFHCYEEGGRSERGKRYRISGPIEHRFYLLESLMIGSQYGTGTPATYRLCKVIGKYAPDIVHIHCPNARSVNLYYLLNYLKEEKIPTIVTNHAEFFYTGNCAHAFECKGYLEGCPECPDYRKQTRSLFFNRTEKAWQKMKKAFEGFDNITMVAVSPWAERRLQSSLIARELPTCMIENGIDTEDIFRKHKNSMLAQKYHDRKMVLHVTSNFSDAEGDAKGGCYILQLAKRLPDMQFVVVGPYHLETQIAPPNVEFVGRVDNPFHLAEYYSAADIMVMTSRRETYGLTCVESLSCGTPVIGFKNGGSETVALEGYSEFVEYGEIGQLERVLLKWVDKKKEISEELENFAREKYSCKTMALKYWELYNRVLTK